MKKHFQKNQTYLTICMYTVMVVLVSCLIIRLVFGWEGVLAHIGNFVSAMSSFFAGLLIAFIINPLVIFIKDKLLIQRFHMKKMGLVKGISLAAAYIIVLGCIIACVTIIIPQLIDSLSSLSKMIIPAYRSFTTWLRGLSGKYNFLTSENIETFINSMTPKITEMSTALVSKIIPWLYDASVTVVKWIVTLFIGIVFSVYLLADKRIIFKAIKKVLGAYFSQDTVQKVVNVCKESNRIFTGYIIAKAIDSIIVGILCVILMLILRLPYAVLVSVLICITNMIPYFGPYLGAIPSILILSVVKLRYGIIFAIMIIILQQLDGVVINPKLLGDHTGVRPLMVLFGVTLGGAYFGILGMFLGVPFIAVIQYLVTLLLNRRIRKKEAREAAEQALEKEVIEKAEP